ncbi:MAG TPA: histidine kinase dimerization/phospho-acceptor domain-containing protein [Candidatus Binatia bacterium]|nr:histidine kinase dimerization/phospho-acceptor domain-containing protein [Candidatus Binatia bacterium]
MSEPAEPDGLAVLPALAAETARAALSPPRLPATELGVIGLATDAGSIAVPVRLEVPARAGRILLARALHGLSGRAGPLVAVEQLGRALGELPAGSSALMHAETFRASAIPLVESLVDDGAVWLLLCTPPGHMMPPALAQRLDAVAVRVPPLRERLAELPDLARHLLAVLNARRGGSAPTLTHDALAHLATRSWPGDVAELEAVLAVGLLRARGAPITARHLTDDEAAASPAGIADTRRAQLEYLVAELAHELRNPLSTVKTFAQLPGFPENGELRARFAALADEAIARMDGLLENVLAFARLGVPSPADVELGPLLDALLGEVRPAFAERGVVLDYVPANGTRCTTDREQIVYALRNVFAGIAREVRAQDAVRIDAASAGLVRVAFDDRGGNAERLRRLIMAEHAVDPDDRTLLPLVFTLARAVLERNGGALTMDMGANGRTALEIRLGASPIDRSAQGG